MATVRYVLQQECCTKVEFVPSGITGITQPMNVAVMKDPRIDAIPEEVIVKGFVRAGIVPVGPRDATGRFRVHGVGSTEAPVVCDEGYIEDGRTVDETIKTSVAS
ncbi:hypothetical protein PPTG_23009 [Phytophthora nicotianae INRA-310]|uniref:Uncharacterized protein n=1 Tax=Phytophthora nicotianae (strain INRA-310) TaxID=761204 RepID=W2Q762_PHYN3|nr:hypothetical protein PPTG_23009 [Phytophthora nicotianae INRA-310]ETN08384.1 hypothetical protein PPTG_23009 [Phytophthora nicotianae INRA-310]